MVKFLKANKAVVMLNGRYAGRKGVIVRAFDDGTRDRPYGHCLVVGISKYPKKVIRKDSAKKTAKKSRVKAFIKLVNYNHIMPTRYTLDVDLKDVVTPDVLQSRDKKVTAAKEVKARFEERFKTGKNRWFFSKLRRNYSNSFLLPAASLVNLLQGAATLSGMVESLATHPSLDEEDNFVESVPDPEKTPTKKSRSSIKLVYYKHSLHDYSLDVNLKDVVISAKEESEEQFRNSCFFEQRLNGTCDASTKM
ncbi:hypothetical protein RJ639_000849 [Escallonia herrerae]|uniref:60S ribosomal protein L27 n=1 Tax=Escallonia herrerae TaxID=1293975 RepID=A0AA88X9U3_9ASTE|nr:hypothetical protein RJ639_000849 [Escallonia herrerae]